MSTWSKTAADITQKLSAADLANIWIRLSYTINEIDNRSENKSKTYAERLELYIAALFNAVYMSCEEKKGNTPDIKNPVTDPDTFYKKLHTYQKCDERTLFDYLNECPALKKDFIELPEDLKDSNDSKTLIDFRNLSNESKIIAIRSIPGWESDDVKSVQEKLQQAGYSNVHARTIMARIKTAKGGI